jgi:hypothetical protein
VSAGVGDAEVGGGCVWEDEDEVEDGEVVDEDLDM